MPRDNLPTPSREWSKSTEIAPRPIREIAAEALGDLIESEKRLIAWGVKIPALSRLHAARDVLSAAVETGVLVPAHRRDDLGLRALELSFDYSAIAESLPVETHATMRRELRDSLTGALDPPESSRGPLQLQSQELVRAAFVRGGLRPAHPSHSPKRGVSSPDLILENGTFRYAVEVKRPQVRKNIMTRFTDGHAQISNYGLLGGILVDVTDALRAVPLDELDDEVRTVALELYDQVFVSGEGHRAGYSNILVAGAFARVAWNSIDGVDNAMVRVHTSSTIGIFARARGTLEDHRARWIRKGFQNGLEYLSQTLQERRGRTTASG
jgi:hypothetical protein